MKTMRLLLITLFFAGIFFACEDKNEKMGAGLETNKIVFSSTADSTIVKCKNVGFELYVFGFKYGIEADTTVWIGRMYYEQDSVWKTTFFDDIFNEEWYSITRPDQKSIFVKVLPNTTGEKREISLDVMRGNEIERLRITQEGN